MTESLLNKVSGNNTFVSLDLHSSHQYRKFSIIVWHNYLEEPHLLTIKKALFSAVSSPRKMIAIDWYLLSLLLENLLGLLKRMSRTQS